MLEYPRWKYILVAVVLGLALILALPNVFGEQPSLQIARKDHDPIAAAALPTVEQFLTDEHVGYSNAYLDDGRIVVRFANTTDQFKARDAVNAKFADEYIIALSFASRVPAVLRAVGLRPMKLGLDLRGGLYLLYQVDTPGSISQLLDSYAQDLRRSLSQANLSYTDVTVVAASGNIPDSVRLTLPDLPFTAITLPSGPALQGTLTAKQIRDRQDYAIQQSLTILRSRVNQLGVAEPIVERQGVDRINVQLPGVQNSAEVKDLLGKVATLEFRMVDTQDSPLQAEQGGHAPLGTKLYKRKDGSPILLKREVIVTGDELTQATSTSSQEGPAVSIKLD